MGRINRKGRRKGKGHFAAFHDWETDSPAFRSLRPVPRSLMIELKRRYFGHNNGDIHLSVREAAKAVNVSPNTARKGFNELLEKGFIKINQRGSFNQKTRHATTWILTEYEYKDQLPTKEFMRLTAEDAARIDRELKNKTRY